MVFGEALEAAKSGRLIAREGWNGKDMFVFMRPGCKLKTRVITEEVQSIPDELKKWVENKYESPDIEIEFTPYLCMKSADNKIVNGWLANQTDMLADDWYIYVVREDWNMC